MPSPRARHRSPMRRMFRHAGIEPVKRLVRDHQRIAHQPTYRRNDKTDQTDQTDQNKLLAAVAARVNAEDDEQRARDVPQPLPQPFRNKKAASSKIQSLLDKAKLKTQEAYKKAQEESKLNGASSIAFLIMHIAYSLEIAIIEEKEDMLEKALQEADAELTDDKAREVIDVYKQETARWHTKVMHALRHLKEATTTIGKLSADDLQSPELQDVASDVEAIAAADPEAIFDEAEREVQNTNAAIRGMTDSPPDFTKHRQRFEDAIGRLQVGYHHCATLVDSFAHIERTIDQRFQMRRRALVSGIHYAQTQKKGDTEALGALTAALQATEDGLWGTSTERKVAFFPYAVIVENHLRSASATPAAPVPALLPTAQEELERILDAIRDTGDVTSQHTTDIARTLCTICGISREELFSMHASVLSIDSGVVHRAIHVLCSARVTPEASDDARRLLKIFEVCALKYDLDTYGIAEQWFVLYGYPLGTRENANLSALTTAISSLYDDKSHHASALPPRFAYTFISDVVADPAHKDKSELQGLVDTANGLIGKENELIDKLGISSVQRIEHLRVETPQTAQANQAHASNEEAEQSVYAAMDQVRSRIRAGDTSFDVSQLLSAFETVLGGNGTRKWLDLSEQLAKTVIMVTREILYNAGVSSVDAQQRGPLARILKICDVALVTKQTWNPNASGADTPWLAFSGYPEVNYVVQKENITAVLAIAKKYVQNARDPAYLPPRKLYEYIEYIVEKRFVDDAFIDAANSLIKGENDLMHSLNIGITHIESAERSGSCKEIKRLARETKRATPLPVETLIKYLQTLEGQLSDVRDCETEKDEIFANVEYHVNSYDATVNTTQFKQALTLTKACRSKFGMPVSLITRSISSLMGLYTNEYDHEKDRMRWTNENVQDYTTDKLLEMTVGYLTMAVTMNAKKDLTGVFGSVQNLGRLSGKVLDFVLTAMTKYSDPQKIQGSNRDCIQKVVYDILDDKAVNVKDKRHARASWICRILKIIDSAFVARSDVSKYTDLAAEWTKVLVKADGDAYDADFATQFVKSDQGSLPPYKAYETLANMPEKFEGVLISEKKRETYKKLAQEAILKDTFLSQIQADGDTSSLQDDVRGLITTFGSTKRRKYAASPWTAV